MQANNSFEPTEQQKPKITIKRNIKAPAVIDQVRISCAPVIIEEDNASIDGITPKPVLDN